jgi:phage replication O-like protein O
MAIRTKEFYERMNKVMEKIALTHLSPNEGKYCWVVFRKTYGFGKYEDLIKRDLMARLTGMDKTTVSSVKSRLIKKSIIQANGDIIRFNLNIDQWEIVKVSSLLRTVKVSSLNSEGRAEKNSEGIVTLQRTNKENSKEGAGGLKKRTRKEINKLEGKEWLRATMIELEGLPKEGTDRFLAMSDFMNCYNAWLALQDAYSVRDKIAWLIAKLKSDPAPEE